MNTIATISSVPEFLNAIPNIDELYHFVGDHRILFRGQADCNWDLLPAVYRNDKPKSYTNEREYVREVIRRHPEQFKFNNSIDSLIKMQHYSLPTRLLDWTGNPLVALYFACDPEEEADGVVVLEECTVFKDFDPTVRTIGDFIVSGKSDDDSSLMTIAKEYSMELSSEWLRSKRYVFFAPSLANDRIKAQDGYFALYLLFDYKDRHDLEEIEALEKIIVPYDDKASIRQELMRIGIHRGSLFPELQNQIKFIEEVVDMNSYQFPEDKEGKRLP